VPRESDLLTEAPDFEEVGGYVASGDISRRIVQALVKKCTLPISFLRDMPRADLVEAVRSVPLYALSVESALAEALELVRAARSQAEAPRHVDAA